MSTLQPLEELERFYETEDPWGYESSPEDTRRREIVLSEIPARDYARVLDIGCGHGFVTSRLPGRDILGVDVSERAIEQARRIARPGLRFARCSLFELPALNEPPFDLVVITGVLYPQYIGASAPLVTRLIDAVLAREGILVSVHISAWTNIRFPWVRLSEHAYAYHDYVHRLEVYAK
ncbi:MAG: trans-aconitate 2-methyltransferase [Lautropia sp.]